MTRPALSYRGTVLCLAATMTLVGLLAGCNRNTPQGRYGVSDTTTYAMGSAEVLPVALIEFSDRMPQDLVAKLHSMPQISETDGRVTVLMGDLNNRTGIVSTNDFEMMQMRIRDNLINSDIAQGKLQFVEGRARLRGIAQREQVGTSTQPSGPAAYDPQRTYVLNGDFYRVSRDRDNLYYMQMTLTRFGGNEIVHSSRHELRQVR